jgi:transposase InsO family protein
LGAEFPTKEDARRAVKQGVWLYNTRRPHNSLGKRLPEEVHRFGMN